MPGESFSVTTEQLRTFAGTLDDRAGELRTSAGVVRSVPTGVSTYGIIGQVFAAKVRTEIDKAATRLEDGADGIDNAAVQVRDGATTYDDTDTVTGDIFGGQAAI